MTARPGRAELCWRARAWRLVHSAWSLPQLGRLGPIWGRLLWGRPDRAAWAGAVFLGVEGAALAIGSGDSPMGGVREEWGDPVPFFELVLPPRAAEAAVPVLAAVSRAGIAGLVLRSSALPARERGR